ENITLDNSAVAAVDKAAYKLFNHYKDMGGNTYSGLRGEVSRTYAGLFKEAEGNAKITVATVGGMAKNYASFKANISLDKITDSKSLKAILSADIKIVKSLANIIARTPAGAERNNLATQLLNIVMVSSLKQAEFAASEEVKSIAKDFAEYQVEYAEALNKAFTDVKNAGVDLQQIVKNDVFIRKISGKDVNVFKESMKSLGSSMASSLKGDNLKKASTALNSINKMFGIESAPAVLYMMAAPAPPLDGIEGITPTQK
ncbi:unnamed protein product, partial [marine sediment metagenome]